MRRLVAGWRLAPRRPRGGARARVAALRVRNRTVLALAALAALHRDLARAVRSVGGPRAIAAAGPPTVNRTFVTHLAWELRTPIRPVELGRGQAVVFRSEDSLSGPPAALRGRRGHARVLVRVGAWEVVRREQLRLAGASVTRFSHFPHQ